MKISLNKVNRLVIVVALLVSSISPSFLPSIANASSIYDNSYHSTNALTVGGPSPGTNQYQCPNVDVTADWYSYLIDESKWHGDRSAAKASFESALANETDGAWGVRQYEDTNGEKAVTIFWSEDPSAELVWDTDGVSINADNNNIYVALIQCEDSMYGGDSNRPVVVTAQKSGQQRISTSTTFSTVNGYSFKTFFANGFTSNYPSNYGGDSISQNVQGGVIKGNVQCANTNNIITNVYVSTYSSTNGSAILTDDEIGGKDYRFYLWDDSPYRLIVTCDGDLFNAPWVNSDFYDYYTWACAPTSASENPSVTLRQCVSS